MQVWLYVKNVLCLRITHLGHLSLTYLGHLSFLTPTAVDPKSIVHSPSKLFLWNALKLNAGKFYTLRFLTSK